MEVSEWGAVVRFVYGKYRPVGTLRMPLYYRRSQICSCDGWKISAVWEVCFRKKTARGIHDMNRLAETIKVRPLEIIS